MSGRDAVFAKYGLGFRFRQRFGQRLKRMLGRATLSRPASSRSLSLEQERFLGLAKRCEARLDRSSRNHGLR